MRPEFVSRLNFRSWMPCRSQVDGELYNHVTASHGCIGPHGGRCARIRCKDFHPRDTFTHLPAFAETLCLCQLSWKMCIQNGIEIPVRLVSCCYAVRDVGLRPSTSFEKTILIICVHMDVWPRVHLLSNGTAAIAVAVATSLCPWSQPLSQCT